MSQETDIKKCLEDFIHNNLELEKLETLAEEFNIFTSLKIIDVEIRHSNFLAWLLDPSENHGFGSSFLRSFLKMISYSILPNQDNYPSVFEIDSWDLDQVQVKREWKHIDLLIIDPMKRFVCVIENKINSSEQDGQLQRYKELIYKEYSDFKYKFFIYLSVEKEFPSDDSYLPINYSEIIPLIEHLIRTKEDKTSKEILIFISHYLKMVKRYIMKNSDVQNICKNIYNNHKRALDLIFEYRQDKIRIINEILIKMIENDSKLDLDHPTKKEILFIPKSLDFIPHKGESTPTKRILLFDFLNDLDKLKLTLYIFEGDIELRRKIYDVANGNRNIFNKVNPKLADKTNILFSLDFLTKDEIDELESDELEKHIYDKFSKFKENEFIAIESELLKLKNSL